MSYEEIMEFAKEHYCDGGDVFYECYSKEDYNRELADGIEYTKESLLKDFACWKNYYNEITREIF